MFKQNANLLPPPPSNHVKGLGIGGEIYVSETVLEQNSSRLTFTQTGDKARDAADVLGSYVTKTVSIAPGWTDGGIEAVKVSLETTKIKISNDAFSESNNVTIIYPDGNSFWFNYSKNINEASKSGIIAVSTIIGATKGLTGLIDTKIYVKSRSTGLLSFSCCCGEGESDCTDSCSSFICQFDNQPGNAG